MFILLQVSFEIISSKGARQQLKITRRGVRKQNIPQGIYTNTREDWRVGGFCIACSCDRSFFFGGGDTNQYIELSLQTDPPACKHNQVSIPNHQTTRKASQRHSGVTV